MEFAATAFEGLSVTQKDNLASAQKIADPVLRWVEIAKNVLSPAVPWETHKTLYDNNYAGSVVAPTWVPSAGSRKTNVEKMMEKHNIKDYNSFYAWSAAEPEAFWNSALQELNVPFAKPYTEVFNIGKDVSDISYLPNAELNVATACFSKRKGNETALIFASETSPALQYMTFDELNWLSNQVANSLLRSTENGGLGLKFGDSVGICMPMSPQAVASYIGIVKAGLAVVSIADSFSAEEIARRMELSDAKAIVTQDVVFRSSPAGVKVLPLFERILDAKMSAKVIVVPAAAESADKSVHDNVHDTVAPKMRAGTDITWCTFLKDASTEFNPVVCPASHICNILFSSGTTGDPKVIPWTHSTPLKCAIDGYMHQDVQVGDIVAWPTNLGWMMGPWLLFQFVNGATIALFGGVTSTSKFCKFVEEAKISMLGVVPSLVKSWKTSNATDGCDWSCVTRFSSSGEASDPIAMQWLMSRANYAPIIEYCGGTEIAGSFLSSTMVQPNVPSMFSTPVLGNNFTIINIVDDESGASTAQEVDLGEIAVIPPSLGLSTRLLNRDHFDCYFKGMPKGPRGEVLRRHGDEIQRVRWVGGSAYNLGAKASDNAADDSCYYRALGRCDDTMNLGGIKVSSAEIERVCNCVPGVLETAAIAINPKNGGPSLLVVFAMISPSLKVDCPDKLSQALADLKLNSVPNTDSLRKSFTDAIKQHLNPLFHLYKVEIVEQMPRTSSNKVMRRTLRDDYYKAGNY